MLSYYNVHITHTPILNGSKVFITIIALYTANQKLAGYPAATLFFLWCFVTTCCTHAHITPCGCQADELWPSESERNVSWVQNSHSKQYLSISISKNAKIDVLIKKQKNKQTNVRTNRYQNIAEKNIVATRHHSDDWQRTVCSGTKGKDWRRKRPRRRLVINEVDEYCRRATWTFSSIPSQWAVLPEVAEVSHNWLSAADFWPFIWSQHQHLRRFKINRLRSNMHQPNVAYDVAGLGLREGTTDFGISWLSC